MNHHHIYGLLMLFQVTLVTFCDDDPPGHMQPMCNYPPLQKAATMDDFPTPEYFFRWLTSPGQPVVFKSVLDKIDFPAYHKWTDDYLREKFGQIVVQTEQSRDYDNYLGSIKWRLMHQFLSDYKERRQYLVQDLKENMKEDIRIPRSLQCGGFQNLFEKFVMWLSRAGSTSFLHNDEYDNINCILDGVKVFKLIDKKYSQQVKADNYNHELGYSTVDVDKVDLHRFPKLQGLPWIEARAEKGDCIFVPKDWFHLVYSTGERNLAVNMWIVPLPVFNASDCQLRELHSEATRYQTSDNMQSIRHTIMYVYKDKQNIQKDDLDLILLKNSRTEENRNQIMKYLDADHDGVVSWDEVLTMDIEEFVVKFIDILHLPPHLDQLKAYLREITNNDVDSYSRLIELTSDAREEL
ncbi:bifunctional peptidase and arginyl-hydroxylase JMJD5-like [Gigantopelta aegis]|uniref:bifunctional peptidase and arginyl-hydroxylase JMJD5-like n=1 Tax=Gigantopelta aegis TaxID=1735272 RepID=UPI001B889D13|nr:bifunctional peptidase and arginyl-hydroxylase JMJD5-like [Gigantopelta aegis]